MSSRENLLKTLPSESPVALRQAEIQQVIDSRNIITEAPGHIVRQPDGVCPMQGDQQTS